VNVWQRWSVKTRLTIIATGVMAVVAIGAPAFVLATLRTTTLAHKTKATMATAAWTGFHLEQGVQPPPTLPAELVAGFQVVDASGRVISASPELAGRPRMADLRPSGRRPVSKSTCSSPAFPGACVLIAAYHVDAGGSPLTVYAADYEVPWYVSWDLVFTLTALSVAVLVITAYGAHATVARVLAPVNAITGRLAAITASDLSLRVPLPRHHDEIRRLAETVNRTLDRVENAVERQRRFAREASHDLRTPLTAMRADIEEALLHPEDADWPRVAQAQLDNIDRLQAIITDLLELARLDSGVSLKLERTDLAELVTYELDHRHWRKVAAVRELTPGVVVVIDRIKIARLLANLLDNSERFAESMLKVIVGRVGDKAVLEVLDDGPGVPPELREAVFQRFMRISTGRQPYAEGTGLGLAIAREIAEVHGGTLTIEDSEVGARFVLRLPLAPEQ
jgi:signal transduction histidine kinase